MWTIINNSTYLTLKTQNRQFDIYWSDISGFTKINDTTVAITRNGNPTPVMPGQFHIPFQYLKSPIVTTIDDLITLLYAWRNTALNVGEYRTGTAVLTAGVPLAVLFKKDGVISPFSSANIYMVPIQSCAITNITADGFTIESIVDQTVTYFAILNS